MRILAKTTTVVNKERDNKQKKGYDFNSLEISLKLPKIIEPVIDSLCRITDKDRNDLCSLLIIGQLNYFKDTPEAILRFAKDYFVFSDNLSEGVKQYYQYNTDQMLR